VTKEFFAVHTTTSARETATGIACDKSTPTNLDCNLAFAGAGSTITTDHKLSSDFSDKQLALAACPTDIELCTTKKTWTFANKDATVGNPTIEFKKASDICSFLIEATCDSPYVYIPVDALNI
jgi:hypothetical protein